MTIKHQGPFKEGEVSQILQRLHDSELRRHAEAIATRDSLRTQFGGDWFASGEAVGAAAEEMDDAFADLSRWLPQELHNEPPASPHTTTHREFDKSSDLSGLFAGEPSYLLSSSEPHSEDGEALPLDSPCPQQEIPGQASHTGAGVNAKTGRSMQSGRRLSTPGRAGLLAGFHLGHAERVVAISELHPDLDHERLEKLLKADAFIQKLMQSYQGPGELPDWAKFVSSEMKQYFRLHLLCTKLDAKTITVRLDRDAAEAALAAPRGPANHLAEIIKRTLAKLGIETDLAFNLEFNHTSSTENHPLHFHGAFCIPDGRVDEASEALRKALAMGYRQRYKNLAVHIEKPQSAHWWAAYCIKEYGITASILKAEPGQKSRPNYATQKLTQEAKAFYEGISDWLNTQQHATSQFAAHCPESSPSHACRSATRADRKLWGHQGLAAPEKPQSRH
jgi:hypothetical protein